MRTAWQGGYTLYMSIWDRLGNVIKSYMNDYEDDSLRRASAKSYSDPDLNAAYEELDDFLRPKESREKPVKPVRPVPAELVNDFAELGLGADASSEECKAAYKKLLKIHHPDKHTMHAENMKKATEKSARVNAAYRRLEDWFRRAGTD